MNNIVPILQVVIALLLAGVILLQGGGSGLGSSWGGGIGGGTSFRSRRGIEKFLLYLAGILAALFFTSSLVSFLL